MSGPNFKKIIEQLSNKLDAISSEEYAKKLDERPLGDVGSFLLETGFFSHGNPSEVCSLDSLNLTGFSASEIQEIATNAIIHLKEVKQFKVNLNSLKNDFSVKAVNVFVSFEIPVADYGLLNSVVGSLNHIEDDEQYTVFDNGTKCRAA